MEMSKRCQPQPWICFQRFLINDIKMVQVSSSVLARAEIPGISLEAGDPWLFRPGRMRRVKFLQEVLWTVSVRLPYTK